MNPAAILQALTYIWEVLRIVDVIKAILVYFKKTPPTPKE